MNSLEISPHQLSEKWAAKEDFVLLDVRTPEEFALVSLKGAVLIPLSELQARLGELKAQASKELVVYCHHGVRSLNATVFLQSQGFRAKSLHGGIDLYAQTVATELTRY